ncbi:MAG: hypothetical protein ACE5HO_09840 [bacterium]
MIKPKFIGFSYLIWWYCQEFLLEYGVNDVHRAWYEHVFRAAIPTTGFSCHLPPIFVLTNETPPWSAQALLQHLIGSKAQAGLAHAKADSPLKQGEGQPIEFRSTARTLTDLAHPSGT